jgi:hypothetical protein
MYANYNRSENSHEFDVRALELKAHGIDSSRNVCADLLNKPSNYYSTHESDVQRYIDCIARVKFQESNTIYNSAETDPQIRAALVNRIIMEDVSGLIDETDRKFLSYICYAIVRGDINALKKLLNGVARSSPQKLSAYVNTLNDHFTNLKAGICFSFQSVEMILLHMYHHTSAIAIDPSTASVAVLSIFTDWDGTVFFAEGSVASPTADELFAEIQEQCVRRILMSHEANDNQRSGLPIVHEQSSQSDDNSAKAA